MVRCSDLPAAGRRRMQRNAEVGLFTKPSTLNTAVKRAVVRQVQIVVFLL